MLRSKYASLFGAVSSETGEINLKTLNQHIQSYKTELSCFIYEAIIVKENVGQFLSVSWIHLGISVHLLGWTRRFYGCI